MRMRPALPFRLSAAIAICLLPVAAAADHQAAPLAKADHDHITYVRPYASALRQAQEERRILIVRPFPVGGVIDGSRDGRWCPLADYMRAMTLSDETLTTLVNRRFVFTYFSLVDWADLSDAEGKRAIVRLAPEYGAKVRQTPPTFFLAPDGELLATLDTMAPAASFVALATRLLAEHPEYARLSPDEDALRKRSADDPRARLAWARVQLELADTAGAASTPASLIRPTTTADDDVRAGALFLLATRARGAGDAAGAARYLSAIDALPSAAHARLATDLAVERAYQQNVNGKREESLRAWSALEAGASAPERLGEILYWKGISYARLGRWREANHTWMRVLQEVPEGRYYQRARLAAMGPGYALASPDLGAVGAVTVRWRQRRGDPSRLPGSDLGYGTSSRGDAGTEATPERFLRKARRDYREFERRRAGNEIVGR
jgi:tetratricopeptide (TPR) repeat protein